MSKSGYSVVTEAEVALAAATAKTVLGINGAADFPIDLKGYWVDFDGVTSSDTSVLVQVGYCTFATNPPGTNSTALTERQVYGRVLAPTFTGARDWTPGSEPTVITVFDEFSLDPNKGLFRYDWPLSETPDADFSDGFVIRLTSAAIVGARAGFRLERA